MNSTPFIILFLTILSTNLVNAAEIRLKNGDIIHGEIIENKGNQIKLSHPTLGVITLSSSQIIPTKKQAVDLGMFDSEFLKNWSREVDLGVNGSKGNSDNMHLHAGARLKTKDTLMRWDIATEYNSSEDSGNKSKNDFFMRFNRDFLIPDANHFYFTEGRYEWDDFQDWDYRISLGGGIGSQLIKTENWLVNGRVGFGFRQDFGGEESTLIPEAVLAMGSNWAIAERHSLELRNTLYPNLTDFGAFRNITALNWKIGLDQINSLDLKVGLQNDHDSKPEGDSKKNDITYNVSLVFKI